MTETRKVIPENRIIGSDQMTPDELLANPKNWRKHPPKQLEAMRGALDEVGWVQQVIYNKRTGHLVDGHMRVEIAKLDGVPLVPVTIVDLSEHEEATVLATLDPIGALAESDAGALDSLLAEIGAVNADLSKMIADTAKDAGLYKDPRFRPREDTAVENQANTERLMRAGSLAEMAPSEEELERLAGRRAIVEFSGGKDSSAAAVWAKTYMPDNIELVYVDLGSEFPTLIPHLHEFANWLGAKELHIVRAESNIVHEIIKKGWPKPHFPWCHNYLTKAFDVHMFGHYAPEDVVLLRGGRMSERSAQRGVVRKTRFMEIKRVPYLFFQPLYFGAKDLCETILAESDAPIWDGYSYGLCRTACAICPGQRTQAYAAIRDHYPEVWDLLMYVEKLHGVGSWSADENGFKGLADRGQKRYEESGARSMWGRHPVGDATVAEEGDDVDPGEAYDPLAEEG